LRADLPTLRKPLDDIFRHRCAWRGEVLAQFVQLSHKQTNSRVDQNCPFSTTEEADSRSVF